ncbi:MAG: hypothetical protein Q8P41_32360 [Pseudomonadota bacterium]|nr:hypothetical protein [Pseudomonadota bacterium]
MNLLLSSLLVSTAPAFAGDPPPPPAVVYTDGARREIEAAVDEVEGWLAAAERREDVDERMCLRAKLTPLTTYAVVAAGASLALGDHLAAGDTAAMALDVRQVSVAVDRARTLSEQAKACLVEAGPGLSTLEDPDLWYALPDRWPEIEIGGGCGDSDTVPMASPC